MYTINTQEVLQWLMDDGSPVIRFRTASELLPQASADISSLYNDVLESSVVQEWLNNLEPQNVNPHSCHGSHDTCFENAMGMLYQLALRAGSTVLDKKTQPIRDGLANMVKADPDKWDVFAMALFAAFFAMIGYRDDAVLTFISHRLDTLYGFTSLGDYDIYDDPNSYKGIPAAFRDKPVIKPALYGGGNYKYPLIYDIYGLSAIAGTQGLVTDGKINTILSYILTSSYHQKIADGYGIVVSPNRRYYNMGWDVKLPGFPGFQEDMGPKGSLLLSRLDLMAHFPCTVSHEWFSGAIRHLESFQTGKGTYLFPRHYLKESTGYWVMGMHSTLGENRRAKNALELESTFRMMLIKKRAGLL